MEQVIGTCSNCNGEVVAFVGAWMSTLPPPKPHCKSCGAKTVDSCPVIQMAPSKSFMPWWRRRKGETIGCLLLALCASASPVSAQTGRDIGDYFAKLQRAVEKLSDNQEDTLKELRKLKCR